MKIWRVGRREVHIQNVFVDADTEEEAIEKVNNGEGVMQETFGDSEGMEYSHTLDSELWDAFEQIPTDTILETYQALAEGWAKKFDALGDGRPDELHELVLDGDYGSVSTINGTTYDVCYALIEGVGVDEALRIFSELYGS